MCGRISVALNKDDLIKILNNRYDINEEEIDYELPRFNVAPSDNVLSIINDGKNYRVGKLQWGFIPFWAKDDKFISINAKAETLSSKPMFKDAYKNKRCTILADGFYEWKKENNRKIPYRFILKDQNIVPLAGLWSPFIKTDGTKIFTCTIITTTPNELMAPIHDRMPLILTKENEKIWLNPEITDDDLLNSLLKPYPSMQMDAYEVSSIVNNPKNSSPDCIKPLQ